MQTKLITAPIYEPFTLQEVKDALRVTHNLQDDYIWGLARSARKACEDAARMAISPQTFKTVYRAPMPRDDEFGLIHNVNDPERILRRLVLGRPPTLAIDSIALISRDTVDRLLLLTPDHYTFDPTWGAVTWSDYGKAFLTSREYPTLEIQFQAGFPVLLPDDFDPGSNLPDPDRTTRQVLCDDALREAIFVTAAQGYDDPDANKSRLPDRAVSLLTPYWNSTRLAG